MPDRQKRTARDVLHDIREQKIRFFDFKFVDLFGSLQHLTVPAAAVDEGTFHSGFSFDGSSVRGFTSISEADMLLRPDADAVFLDPFFDEPTLSTFCNVVDPERHATFSRDPRAVAQRAERIVQSLGIADTAYFAPEMEFYVFDGVRFEQTTQHGFYYVNAEGAFWNTGQDTGRNLAFRLAKKRGYFAAPPGDLYHNLRCKISDILASVGVEPELHHHEVGAAGQNEIGFRYGPLTTQADRAIKFKYVVKNTARRYDKTATFMPKPLFEEAGSGMHCNMSLWKEGRNLFYEAGGYADLSDLARWYTGGILKHAAALCAFTNPSTNSYRRLVPGYEAPVNLIYSHRNRSACVRVPMVGANKTRKRIEYRTPDPSCNPYLAFAAILQAGLDGVVNRIEPPDPVDENLYEIEGSEQLLAAGHVPSSFEQAIDALEADHAFLTENGVFTQDLVDIWIRHKREHEINYIGLRPHPSEFALYFDV